MPSRCLRRCRAFAFSLLCAASISCGGGGGGGEIETRVAVELFLEDLSFPVKIAFAPDGRMFFTELASGKVRVVEEGALREQVFAEVAVPSGGGNGLTGLALDPRFEENRFVYIYFTRADSSENLILRLRDEDGVGVEPMVLLDGIPVGEHNGGALRFGDDETLVLGTGDAGDPSLSQDPESLAGKILRIRRDGTIPDDNPFSGSPIFASGFRNVFGLDFNPRSGVLYVSENGPDCDDELNRVRPGQNFGWRTAQPCGDTDPEFEQPLTRINPSIGPTGVLFYQGNTFPGLRDRLLYADFNTGAIRLYRVSDSASRVLEESILFEGGLGGVLGLAEGPDGFIYFSTPEAIYRLVPAPEEIPEPAETAPEDS